MFVKKKDFVNIKKSKYIFIKKKKIKQSKNFKMENIIINNRIESIKLIWKKKKKY